MNKLVMLTQNEDKDTIPVDERKWCLVVDAGGSDGTACEGAIFGYGEGDAQGELKAVGRGGITCSACIDTINYYKSVRL